MTADFAWQPGLEDTAEVDYGVTRNGLSQLRRYWPAPDARATVLLIHGIAEHCGRYEHVARQLVAAGISVVGFDQRGFGESGGRRGHVDVFEEFHDDVEDQLDELRALAVPVVLLGHSMGGLVAASYALADRPQADLVVLSAPALGADLPGWLAGPMSVLGRVFGSTRVPLPLKPDALATDHRVGDAYVADPLVSTPASLRLVGEMASAMRAVEHNLDAWTVPALIVHGLDDELIPPVASEALGQRPEVTRLTYPGLRHELFNEPSGPDVVADVLAWIEVQLADLGS